MNYIKSAGSCCTPSCTTPTVVNTPGPQGPAGVDGADGANGQPGFTTVTDGSYPVQPAIGLTVTIQVASSTWMIPAVSSPQGMIVCIGGSGVFMGYYRVVSLNGANEIVIENLGYPGNAGPGTAFTVGMAVTASGPKGADAVVVGTGILDVVVLGAGVATQAITAPGGSFGFNPTAVVATIMKPSGGMNIFASVHTIGITGFTADFSALIPATGYSLQYVAYP